MCTTFAYATTGKTTVLYKLKLGEFVQTIPTIGTALNNEEKYRSPSH